MLKKIATMLGVGAVVCTLMIPSFAADEFEVLSPNFDKTSSKNLLINIRIHDETPLDVSLIRIEPDISVDGDDESIAKNMDKRLSDILATDEFVIFEDGDVLVDYDYSDQIKQEYTEEERRQIADTYLKKLRDKNSKQKEFLSVYDEYRELAALLTDRIPELEPTEEEQKVLMLHAKLNPLLKAAVYAVEDYELFKPVYESIFETVVFEESIQIEGVMPFYRATIEDIEVGEYRLQLESDDEVLYDRSFEVSKLEEEKIKKETTDLLNSVINSKLLEEKADTLDETKETKKEKKKKRNKIVFNSEEI